MLSTATEILRRSMVTVASGHGRGFVIAKADNAGRFEERFIVTAYHPLAGKPATARIGRIGGPQEI